MIQDLYGRALWALEQEASCRGSCQAAGPGPAKGGGRAAQGDSGLELGGRSLAVARYA